MSYMLHKYLIPIYFGHQVATEGLLMTYMGARNKLPTRFERNNKSSEMTSFLIQMTSLYISLMT